MVYFEPVAPSSCKNCSYLKGLERSGYGIALRRDSVKMEDLLVEELEAVSSIFSEELSVSEGRHGCKVVQYRIKGDLVFTVELHGT